MAVNQQIDSRYWDRLDFPYNRIEAELAEDPPRFIRGQNVYVTTGGKLAKRCGTVALSEPDLAGRVDRLWIYETLDTPPKVFMLASVYDPGLGTWSMWYQERVNVPAPWAQITSLRDVNDSTRPHEAVAAKGLFYIKGFPDSGGDKLGTVVFDGSPGSPTVRPWGLLGPQTPARINGAVTFLTADIDNSTTTITVDGDTDFPATPFTIYVDFEEMQVTAGLPGTSWTVTRGFNGTTAAGHFAGVQVIYKDFDPSDHYVQVNLSWRYAYAYKSITGQISNISPLEENPDLMPSGSGPFFNLLPEITVQGTADTTNVPEIVIYRTTDGGGTFYELETITNTGPGDITYIDDSLESGAGGGTFADPIPDSVLTTNDRGPTLTSNSPPPTVLAPEVTGVDTPMASTPLVTYSGRIWMGLGNILFYSGLEELFVGVPEECWPSGITGNFFRFPYPITNLQETTDGLYVFTIQNTYKITGVSQETFSARPIFENLGAPYGQPRAITRFGETVVVLTHDFRVALIEGENYSIMSEPLYTDLVDAYNLGNGNSQFDIKYWGDLDKQWLVVACHRQDDTEQSRQWVLDFNRVQKTSGRPFWFLPWTIPAVAMASGRIENNSPQRRLVFFNYDAQTYEVGVFARVDPTNRTGTDYAIDPDTGDGDNLGYPIDFVTGLFTVPTGDHVNTLRAPNLSVVMYNFILERMVFAGDTDPNIFYFFDDFWTDPAEAEFVEDPARRYPSKGYKTMEIQPGNIVCRRFAIELSKLASAELFEMQSLTIGFLPDMGA